MRSGAGNRGQRSHRGQGQRGQGLGVGVKGHTGVRGCVHRGHTERSGAREVRGQGGQGSGRSGARGLGDTVGRPSVRCLGGQVCGLTDSSSWIMWTRLSRTWDTFLRTRGEAGSDTSARLHLLSYTELITAPASLSSSTHLDLMLEKFLPSARCWMERFLANHTSRGLRSMSKPQGRNHTTICQCTTSGDTGLLLLTTATTVRDYCYRLLLLITVIDYCYRLLLLITVTDYCYRLLLLLQTTATDYCYRLLL